MEFSSEAHSEFVISLNSIDTLIHLAESNQNTDDTNRKLFLKLSVVLLVTRLQVYIEKLLSEFSEFCLNQNINYANFPVFGKLNSLKIFLSDIKLEKKLENPSLYNQEKYDAVKDVISQINSHFENVVNQSNLKFNTSFPLGKTGAKELVELFKQFEGKNIFSESNFDTNILNSILFTRHSIIHQDSAQSLTEVIVKEHKRYIEKLSEFLLGYLKNLVNHVGILT